MVQGGSSFWRERELDPVSQVKVPMIRARA